MIVRRQRSQIRVEDSSVIDDWRFGFNGFGLSKHGWHPKCPHFNLKIKALYCRWRTPRICTLAGHLSLTFACCARASGRKKANVSVSSHTSIMS